MKQLIIALCFALAATPYAFAQEKGKATEKKSSVVAEKTTKSDAQTDKGDEKKAGKGMESAKREPTEKQKAQQARMRDCAAKAGDRKGDERKKFMSECLAKA